MTRLETRRALDLAYLEDWVRRIGLEALWPRIQEKAEVG